MNFSGKSSHRFLAAILSAALLSCALGCGGSSKSSSHSSVIATSGSNVAPITVGSGPTGNYADGAFATVTVCAPGTSTCATIDGVLVDTGSTGLRILSSLLPAGLTQQTSGGNPVLECFPFVSGYTWGPIETADIEISGEKASSAFIQAIGSNDTVPSGCLSYGLPSSNTLATLGANGILGVGLFAQDCGVSSSPTCPASANVYYECPSASSCSPISAVAAQQVQNPVTLFSSDNNGVIVELPAVTAPEASLGGSLVFGIGTQSNNAVGSATVYTADPNLGNFSTTFNGVDFSDAAFLDSGSNGYFFPDSSIPQCGTGASGFYCPSSTENLSATNQGFTQGSGTVSFSVANALNMFNQSPSDAVYPNLAGTTGTPPANVFDWGLPFFFGRNVFVAIDGASTPSGNGPFWAY